MTKRLKSRGRGVFPWEYDALVSREDQARRLKGRRRKKALNKLERQRQRIRRSRAEANKPLDSGIPKTIRVWPQGWRVPTSVQPLSAKEYARYLETPHWQEFRDRYRASDRLQACFVCGEEDFELHHHTYVRIGHEGLDDVVPLCEPHHRAVHKAVKAGVALSNAHTYIKMRFQCGELGLRRSKLEN